MKNTHIEHPEDTILTGDLSVLDWMCAKDSYLSTKIDGAPAIVWGTNPATGNFFVGTKSVFNKVKIKINESHADIDANHTGNVADILHACFDNLPDTGCIFQGDFIGFGGGVMYTPNTITYIFDDVITEDIIIAPHTIYVAESDLRDAIASPMILCPKSTSACKFIKPDAEICPYRDDIEDVCKFARQMSTLCNFVNEKQSKELKKVINSYIREGKPVNEHDIAELHDVDINLLRLWKLVYSIKMDLFCFIECDDSMDCYIGGEQVAHEGFVMHNEFGSYKVVDRETFSRLNFTIAKSW
ncbi:hypothetical protein SynMITS9220M01_059 [Synechococcus phage SynMITS9220M01]|nr:hypothetical protein SynMITS9220M01_059 [Synechococcus phage SynMITS9220M01]